LREWEEESCIRNLQAEKGWDRLHETEKPILDRDLAIQNRVHERDDHVSFILTLCIELQKRRHFSSDSVIEMFKSTDRVPVGIHDT